MPVYFIRPVGAAGPVKIGYSSDVAQRLESLQGGSPLPLEIVAIIERPQCYESALHWRLSESRIHGEWFRPDPDVLALVARFAVEPKRARGGHQRGCDRNSISREIHRWLDRYLPLTRLEEPA